ncbi:hypothetical protein SDC9_146035 [bioreactor metagenome]|uniref:Uncharacterized protein n=1 Tax=bioreactor metagenome TaxID=1076179 RepID=A0A645EBI1_9ZZZZ
MRGAHQHLAGHALFHALAHLHDHHVIRDFRDHAKVVRDEQHRRAPALLQLADQLQDLRLRRHVERRGRLIGD